MRAPRELLESRVLATFKNVVEESARRLADRTPVVTGVTVSNWNPAVAIPLRTWSESASGGRSGVVRRTAAILDPLVQPIKVFLTNSVPWMGVLEFGRSGKEPRGIVRTTTAEAGAITRIATRKARRRRRRGQRA